MENQQPWRLKLSFKNATILVCFVNIVTFILLLQGFLGVSNRKNAGTQPDQARLRYVLEGEELRRAMEPLELIKRVKEIRQEVYTEPEVVVQEKDPKKTAALDLSKRLNDLRSLNDANSKRAIEEWRKRKIERDRIRQMEKNGTVNAQQA
ncbi:uncharacterized protein LOC143890204 [Tasmannia lanceolata]|uniref:uncharacterized protein LOC143890204 n=1 Tax=Tasmannia lanceolata TaxID=3420 RepID=UPI004062AF13